MTGSRISSNEIGQCIASEAPAVGPLARDAGAAAGGMAASAGSLDAITAPSKPVGSEPSADQGWQAAAEERDSGAAVVAAAAAPQLLHHHLCPAAVLQHPWRLRVPMLLLPLP